MRRVNFDVEERKQIGKGSVGRLRRFNFVPAILYGGKDEASPLKVDRKKLISMLNEVGKENVLINLTVKRDSSSIEQLAILKHLDRDPVTDQILHLDFQRVSMKERIVSKVHIVLKGEAEGVKEGGIVEQALRTIEVECLPKDMPEHFEVDISNLKIHNSVHVRDIPVPPNVKVLTDRDRVILSVLAPRKVEEIVEAAKEKVEMIEPQIEGKEEKEEEIEEEKEEEKEKKKEKREKGKKE